jgi:hypothetical protein
MASRPIFSDIDEDSFEGGRGRSKGETYVEDPFIGKKAFRRTHKLAMKTSEWVQHFVKIKDADKAAVVPLDFSERRYLTRVYDTPARKVLLMTSRQTEKSTTLGNKLLSLVGMRPLWTSLFVTPSAMQTKVFSSARLDDITEVSPALKALTHPKLTMNLLEKEYLTKARIYLRYAFLSADRIRGVSANALFVDEIQDILNDLMPVMEETVSHHKDQLFLYSGTPKTFDNTIEKYWAKASTQSEWVIPCEAHAPFHWNVLGPKNIGKTGPICEKCGKALNPEHPMAQWVEMNPGAEFEGYRICRLMVPWFAKNLTKWQEFILHPMERYATANFMNEVMALSYDSGVKPLTRGDVVSVCDNTDTYLMDEDQVAKLSQSHQLYGGIDWGTGERAYTVMVVGGYVRGDANFQVVYAKRFDEQLADPEPQMAEIIRLINKFRLHLVGVDYGMGFHPNKKLSSIYSPKRIHQFQYVAKSPRKIVYKGALGRYLVFRTPLMADIFSAIKNKKIWFPKWEVWKEPFAEDMLSIHSEYSETLRMVKYDKPRGVPDDTFHALCYCMMASFLVHRRPDILMPIQEPASAEEAAARAREDAAIEEMDGYVSNDYAVANV